MLDQKKIAEFEQSIAMLVETFPPMLWRLFTGLVKEGFTEAQALHLTGEYLKRICTRQGGE